VVHYSSAFLAAHAIGGSFRHGDFVFGSAGALMRSGQPFHEFGHDLQCKVCLGKRAGSSARTVGAEAHWTPGGGCRTTRLYFVEFGSSAPCQLYFRVLIARFGSNHASVTALSMICRWTLLQCGQVNVRKSRPLSLGSIAVSFIGDPHAVHCGPWFCASSMGFAFRSAA
jgi:hypothetical protein